MKRTHWALMAVLFLLFVLPVIVPLLYSFSLGWSFPDIIPDRYGLRSYEYVWNRRGDIAVSLGYSVLYSFLTAVSCLLICLFPAQVLARRDFKFKFFLEGLLLAPALAPVMTFSMGLHFLFIKTGLADSMAGVVLVLTIITYPYMLRTLISGYRAFSPNFSICAQNLGAGPLTTLFRVEWPLLAPSIIAGGSVVFLIAFSEYFLVFLIGGGLVPSYSGLIFPFLTSSDRSLASLLTLIFLATPILLFFLIEIMVMRIYRRMGLD